MSEQRAEYLLQPDENRATMSTETSVLRGKLRSLKVQLISVLVEVDRALGDEPSVMTRAERRRR